MNAHKVAITVDIEDWYHVPAVTGSPYSVYADVDEFFREWRGRWDYLTEPTKRVLHLLDAFGITATFFVVADVTSRYPGLVESIAERGHEIGCHGLSHACKIDPRSKKPLVSASAFEERTVKARNILERTCRDRVVGYRAPNGYIGEWMFRSLSRIGFKYDSSVSANSLYNKTDMSLRGASSCPYNPLNGNTRFTEFPWAYLNLLGLRIPSSGGPMLRYLGAGLTWQGLRQSLKRGHTVFYFHPIDICEDEFPYLTRGQRLFWVFKGRVAEKRVKHIINNLKEHRVPTSCLRDLVTP